MPKLRRYYVPDAIYFVTIVVRGRQQLFADENNVALLWQNLRLTRQYHPFKLWAYAFLPEHLHVLLQPDDPKDISTIWNSVKSNFTKDFKAEHQVTDLLSLWQGRFWDHIIRDSDDLQHHFDYTHYNPVKHGLVLRPEEYAISSYQHWLQLGYYEAGWGWMEPDELRNSQREYGEP